jgi:hypothetical protein
MRQFLSRPVAVFFAAVLLSAGCSSRQEPVKPGPDPDPVEPGPGPKPADVEPAALPTELVGKWRLEVGDGKGKRTSVYHFTKDGRFEVESHIVSPDFNVTDRVRRAVLEVEKDRITFADIAHVSAEGTEDIIPPERLRPRTAQFRVQGDELHWTAVANDGKPAPGAKPTVLKRVKE